MATNWIALQAWQGTPGKGVASVSANGQLLSSGWYDQAGSKYGVVSTGYITSLTTDSGNSGSNVVYNNHPLIRLSTNPNEQSVNQKLRVRWQYDASNSSAVNYLMTRCVFSTAGTTNITSGFVCSPFSATTGTTSTIQFWYVLNGTPTSIGTSATSAFRPSVGSIYDIEFSVSGTTTTTLLCNIYDTFGNLLCTYTTTQAATGGTAALANAGVCGLALKTAGETVLNTMIFNGDASFSTAASAMLIVGGPSYNNNVIGNISEVYCAAPNGTISSSFTISGSDSNSGTIANSSVSGSSTTFASTGAFCVFTYSPSGSGARTLSITNTGGLGTNTFSLNVGGTIPITAANSVNSGTLGISPGNWDYIESISGLSITGTTTSGSAVITMASTAGLKVGMYISGSAIPPGQTILSIVPNTSITISANCTANGTNSTLLYGYFSTYPLVSQYGLLNAVQAHHGAYLKFGINNTNFIRLIIDNSTYAPLLAGAGSNPPPCVMYSVDNGTFTVLSSASTPISQTISYQNSILLGYDLNTFSAGTFTITDPSASQTTAAIAYNATNATIQAAIRAALTTNWSTCVVTGSASATASTDIPLGCGTNSLIITNGSNGAQTTLTFAQGTALAPVSGTFTGFTNVQTQTGTGSLPSIQTCTFNIAHTVEFHIAYASMANVSQPFIFSNAAGQSALNVVRIMGIGADYGSSLYSLSSSTAPTQFSSSALFFGDSIYAGEKSDNQNKFGQNNNSTYLGIVPSIAAALNVEYGLWGQSQQGWQYSGTGGNMFSNSSATNYVNNWGTTSSPTNWTGSTTNGSAVITTSLTSNVVAGMYVFGPNVPAGATVVSIVANTSVTISANCTGTASNQSMTAGYYNSDKSVQGIWNRYGVGRPINFAGINNLKYVIVAHGNNDYYFGVNTTNVTNAAQNFITGMRAALTAAGFSNVWIILTSCLSGQYKTYVQAGVTAYQAANLGDNYVAWIDFSTVYPTTNFAVVTTGNLNSPDGQHPYYWAVQRIAAAQAALIETVVNPGSSPKARTLNIS